MIFFSPKIMQFSSFKNYIHIVISRLMEGIYAPFLKSAACSYYYGRFLKIILKSYTIKIA